LYYEFNLTGRMTCRRKTRYNQSYYCTTLCSSILYYYIVF